MNLAELKNTYQAALRLIRQKNLAEARALIGSVLAERPDDTAFLLLQAHADIESAQYADAERGLTRLLALVPQHDTALALLGKLHALQGRWPQSLSHYRRALEINYTADNHFAVIQATRMLADNREKREAALRLFDEFLQRYPEADTAYYYRSLLQQQTGRYAESLADIDRFLSRRPQRADALLAKAMLLLKLGRLREGFALYEHRLSLPHKNFAVKTPLPLWQGQPLNGQKLFVYAEQGLGDNIQFVRYAHLAKQQGLDITVGNFMPLQRLLGFNLRRMGIDTISEGGLIGEAAYQVSMMSLPHYLGADSVPLTQPYIEAEPDFIEKWRQKIPNGGRRKIGIVWQGSLTNDRDKERSIPLPQLAPLFALNAEFHCLQKAVSEQDAAWAQHNGAPVLWHHDIGDFSDTAGLIGQMDYVISVDTSVAHLAAAMGKPTWIMITFDPDFRWQLGRSDSIWYSDVRLFRQNADMRWDSVIQNVCGELAARLAV